MRLVMRRLWLLSLLLILTLVSSPAAAQGTSPSYLYEIVDLANGADLTLARAQAINLNDYPVVPTITGSAAAVFRQGQRLGRNPHVLSKVGDCNTIDWIFLYPFGENQYDLGSYSHLQGVVNYFADSYAYRTYAAQNGMNAYSVLDPIWASPTCQDGESPLRCEYRVHNPSVAIIMFGSNDVLGLTPLQYDHSLRRIIAETIQAGIIPILSTFPRYLPHPDRSILYNQIAVRTALDFNIPLINLWRALESLPSHGIADDGYHLNGPLTRAADFASERNLQTGYPTRNLVTLQTLDVIWREVIAPSSGR